MWKKLLNIEKKAPDQVQHVFHQDQPGTGQPGPQPVGGGTGAAPPSILQSSPSQSPMSAEPIFVPVPEGKAKHVHEPSRDTFDIAGLPVFVYGLSQLSPPTEKGCPEVCIAIHMHGRTGSAKREDDLARELWRSTMSARAALPSSHRVRDFLLVTFDQRNHGERKTNPRGQKSWKEGNPTHGIDMYGMIHGTATDASFLAEMLPPYLFPNDERLVSMVAVTGKSLGGHAVWQVLAHDPRIRIGVSFIGTPDFQKLIAHRAKTSHLTDGPPQVPFSLRSLMRRIDPAMQPYREPSPQNPFFGKKICACSGQDDNLVRWSYSEEFLQSVVVAPPHTDDARRSLQVFVQPKTGHKVTSEMLYQGGRWLAQWALAY